VAAIRTELQPKELDSLRQLSGGAMKKHISVEHAEKLVHCGYAMVQAGAVVITIRGHAKLAYEITRASWFSMPV
jgi:hypothetical protein